MATQTESQKKLPSQENLLLDYIRRLEKHKKGRKVVHVHLSKLRPFNRRDQHIRMAAGHFEKLIKDMHGQVFVLKNADLFFIFKSQVLPQTETAVRKIQFVFSDDPLVTEDGKDGVKFATWYDAEKDFDKILKVVQGLSKSEQNRKKEVRSRMDARAVLKAKQEQGEPLTPEVLARIETALSRADLSNLVRRQFVCNVDRKMVPVQEFSELFISIKDLRETLMPGVNMLSNRWLFRHLTETLDLRMLSMLTKTDTISLSGDISFNVNVATLLSREFQNFDDNIAAGRRGSMIIELQKEDIFSDLESFLFVREFVQEKGYKVCIDGLTLESLQMIDRGRLGLDMSKLLWHPDLVDGGEPAMELVRTMVKHDGPEKIILIRCDSREAIDFGHTVGITRFQGRYVETLIAEDNRRRELLRLKRRIERN